MRADVSPADGLAVRAALFLPALFAVPVAASLRGEPAAMEAIGLPGRVAEAGSAAGISTIHGLRTGAVAMRVSAQVRERSELATERNNQRATQRSTSPSWPGCVRSICKGVIDTQPFATA